MDIILWEVPHLIVDQKIIRQYCENVNCETYNFEGDGNDIGSVPLLYEINGNSISIANIWLIHLKANQNNKYVNSQAQALLHYFSFLHKINKNWDDMPIQKRLRPTYAFRKYLRDMHKDGKIARTTANNYMNAVINFYKFYLSYNYNFENVPFNYEIVQHKKFFSHEYMRHELIHVATTDLRLKLPTDTSYYGLSRKLVPLNSDERTILDKYCKHINILISENNTNENNLLLTQEFIIAIELARYCGLRRSEIITIRSNAFYKPNSEQDKKKYLNGSEGLTLDPKFGVNTKNGTIRIAEIPTQLMHKIYNYTNSTR